MFLLNLFGSQFKSKLIFLLVSLLITSVLGSALIVKKYIALRNDKNRILENYYNKEQQIQTLKDKNGTLHYVVNGLQLTVKEFEKDQVSLVTELKNMRIKLKHAESVSNTVIKYQWKSDTIYKASIENTTSINKRYRTIIDNQWLSSSWNSTITGNGDTLNVSDYQVQLNDSLLFVTETVYKGWWIFRKAKGVKLHVKSKNPYSTIEQIEYIKFAK